MSKNDNKNMTPDIGKGHSTDDNKQYKAFDTAMREHYPRLYEFLKPLKDVHNSRRIGHKRMCFLYELFSKCPWITAETGPHDLGSDPETFWDLAEKAAEKTQNRAYAMETIFLLYQHLGRLRKLRPSFREGFRTPANLLENEEFRKFMLFTFTKKENVFILRHGQMKKNTMLLILDYRNHYLREVLIESAVRWSDAWVKRRVPSPLKLLEDAEGWFEGTTDAVRSWTDFTPVMLNTARHHIVKRYADPEDRRLAMRFLFHFWSELVLGHPEHDFFKGSLFWCPELVVHRLIPNHLADGYEIAISGQRDPFAQGCGALFVLQEADLQGASYRRVEIQRFDLSDVTEPRHWNALANFILHNKKENFFFIRKFLIWLDQRKKPFGEDPCKVLVEDVEAYRTYIANRTKNGTSRNAALRIVKNALRWMSAAGYLTVETGALEKLAYFLVNFTPSPTPLGKEAVAILTDTLHEMGKKEPRYYLSEIIFRILLISEPRAGSVATLAIDDITWYDDGTCLIQTLQKASGRERTPIVLPREAAALLRKAIELTKPVREKYPMMAISSHVFIYEIKDHLMPVNAMSIQRFSLDLKDACKAAGLKPISTGMIRDTMFSIMRVYMAENRIPEYKRRAITHHKRRRSINAYAVISIQDILEKAPRYTVGKIIKRTEKTNNNVKEII